MAVNLRNLRIGRFRTAVLIMTIVAVGYLLLFIAMLRSDGGTPAAKQQQQLTEESPLKVDKKVEEEEEEKEDPVAAKLRLENAALDRKLQQLTEQLHEAEEKQAAAAAAAHAAEEEAAAAKAAAAAVRPVPVAPADAVAAPAAWRPGVIVLGMHRSGTSIIGGLLNKMGLNTGGPLIRPWHDNEKGFFERVDVVVQNDAIMQKQRIDYAQGTFRYNALKGLHDVLANLDASTGGWFTDGRAGLAFLNDPRNYPWMLKDPRLCITLRTWLPLLNFVPAVLFTYRHPMDVAMSMHKRETEHFRVQRGLKLWYVYNKRAIQQSNDLCRVTTDHKKMMATPKAELDRVHDELRACGVAVPHRAESADINEFIDPKLQHGRSALADKSCAEDIGMLTPDPAAWVPEDDESLRLYRACTRLFCDLESGAAYQPTYTFDDSVTDA